MAAHSLRGLHHPTGRARRSIAARMAAQAQLVDPVSLDALARRAVEAAHAAGATYADAHVTRTIQHHYEFTSRPAAMAREVELLGLGVRVLMNGYWGFSASPIWTPAEAVRLAQEAAAQAKVNARGKARTVDLGQVPAVTGRWATPVQIDPFTVTIEEKADTMAFWMDCAKQVGLRINQIYSYLHFARQEQVVATSEGTAINQTFYESGGLIQLDGSGPGVRLTGVDVAGKGWERFIEAKVPEQIAQAPARMQEILKIPQRLLTVGQYTLVCDGLTMARIVEQTFGLATQLDRALGYEANAGGTSYLNDPLGMLGTLQVAAPMVTITANRSAPAQLATAKWDAEGVEPQETTLVKDGVLTDFQTTREQAAWLAPYYQKVGKPVRSHGYAASEDALAIPMQHMPNLALAPAKSAVRLEDLVANVTDGLLVTDLTEQFGIRTDHQARNGFFSGTMQRIKNGRLGPIVSGCAVLFNTQDLWKHVVALGGPETEAVYSATALYDLGNLIAKLNGAGLCKGQPQQLTGHSVRAPAATITSQALIDLRRKA